MLVEPKSRLPILDGRTFRHVSWRQGKDCGVWPQACFTQECLAVKAESILGSLKPVQLRLILGNGEMVLTQGILTSRLEQAGSTLMLFTLALTQADVALIRACPPDPKEVAVPVGVDSDSTHRVALALIGAALLGLVAALLLG
ncbi:MAG: hypothetical protein ACI9VR_002627 [Cognaticolwellia sp.]|jgi:hypothetical protein